MYFLRKVSPGKFYYRLQHSSQGEKKPGGEAEERTLRVLHQWTSAKCLWQWEMYAQRPQPRAKEG